MFIREKYFPKRFKFNSESFNRIIGGLADAGFNNATIKIPREYANNFRKSEFTPKEFIKLNSIFASQILIVTNGVDVLKIFFANNPNVRTSFNDSIFSGGDRSARYHIEVKDPTKIVGLIDFLDHLLAENSSRNLFVAQIQYRAAFLAYMFLFFYGAIFMDLFDGNKKTLWLIFENHVYGLTSFFIVAAIYVLIYTITPGGLYLKKFEHPIVLFSKRVTVGDLKNNLLIKFCATILKLLVGGFLVNLLWYFLGDTTISKVKYLMLLISQSH